jgi:hypothetical protein
MRFDTGDDSFRRDAMAWLQSLADDTITDLPTVFFLSPGYYPTTLVGLWRTEVSRRGLESVASSTSLHAVAAHLPVCHPGDYEWRFTPQSAAALLEAAVAGLPGGALVAHIGTPTTFMAGRDLRPQLTHALVERNAAVVEVVGDTRHVYQMDLISERPPALGAQAAIVDPPWYPADTSTFLVATSRICAPGARIVLCQPTLATRPGVAEERAALFDELPRLGYTCRRIDAARARYRMPHFEAASLRIAAPGVVVPDDWRVGDVLTLEKVADAAPGLAPRAHIESWQEAAFGPVRIKLRRTESPDLGSIVPGDVLDTVSRRDPVRQRIGLWTSGNRVFSLESPEAIGGLIKLCHTDVMQSQFTLTRTLEHARVVEVDRRTARKLFEVLLIEFQEHALRQGA